MRTYTLLFFAVFALISCDDIQDNSPALQVVLNNQLFRAIDARAEIMEDGTLVLQGVTDVEGLTITLNNSTAGVYNFSGIGTNRAVFKDFSGSIYTTRPFGDGQVVIQNVNENSLSGTFKFNAFRFGLDTLNAQKGVFFKVPILNGTTTEEPIPLVGILNGNINGVAFNADQIFVTETNNLIVIDGRKNTESIMISFPNSLINGNFPVGSDITASYTLNGVTMEAVVGNISVVNHNTTIKEISGAYSFQTQEPNVVQVSQGQFNVSY